jgi:hypothetical protein
LKFTYVFNTDSIGFYVNNDVAGMVSVTGVPQQGMRLFMGFNMEERKVSYDISNNNILPIKNFVNGEKFVDFTDGLAYVSYVFEEVAGETTMAIHTLNGHYFSEETRDWIAPMIEMKGDVGGEFTLWDEAVLPTIIANDVLSGNVDAYVTLTSPSGNYMTTMDGKVLNNVRYDGTEWKVVFGEYGDYVLSISCQDNTGNYAMIPVVYSVVDQVKPTLTISGEVVSTAKVGENVSLPTAQVSDNLEGELTLVVYVIMPNGHVLEVKEGDKGFTATKAGVYMVVYSVSDEQGNFDYKYYKITVTEA